MLKYTVDVVDVSGLFSDCDLIREKFFEADHCNFTWGNNALTLVGKTDFYNALLEVYNDCAKNIADEDVVVFRGQMEKVTERLNKIGIGVFINLEA